MNEKLKQMNREEISAILENQNLLGTFAALNSLTLDYAKFVLQKSLNPDIELTEIENSYYMSSDLRQQELIAKQDAHRTGFWKGAFGGMLLTLLGVFIIDQLDD